jgi:hypothetical protein
MPAHDPTGEWPARWFRLAMETAVTVTIGKTPCRIIAAPCFVATKLEAFSDRGNNDDQLHRLLKALKAMLNAHNWSFVLQTVVPERIQYAAIQDNFDQEALVKTHHMGFFQLCRPGTPHGTCALDEHCQCRFYAEFFAGFVDEDLTPEEERARALEIEVEHIKRKYGEEWRKYYPYHLDPEYDDEEGNPHDYGFGQPEEPDPGDWWRGE